MPTAKAQLISALIVTAVAVPSLLVLFAQLPATQHTLRLLRRMRAAWGIPLCLLVAAPWFISMSLEHGWPFWNEFIF